MDIIKHISVWGFNYFIAHDPVEDTYVVQCSWVARIFRKGYVKAMQEVIAFSQQEEVRPPRPMTLIIKALLHNKAEDVEKIAWANEGYSAPSEVFQSVQENILLRGEEIFKVNQNMIVTDKYYYVFFEVAEEEHF